MGIEPMSLETIDVNKVKDLYHSVTNLFFKEMAISQI